MSGYALGLGVCPSIPTGFVNPNCSGNCPPGMCWTGHCDTTRNPATAICHADTSPSAGYVTPTTPIAVAPAPAAAAPAPTVTIAPVQTSQGPGIIVEPVSVPVSAPTQVPTPTPSPYAQCPAGYPYGYLNPQGELVCLHAQDGAQAAPLPAGQSSPVGAPVDTSTGYVAPDAASTPPSWWTDPTQALVDSIPNLYAVPVAVGLLYFVVKGMGKR